MQENMQNFRSSPRFRWQIKTVKEKASITPQTHSENKNHEKLNLHHPSVQPFKTQVHRKKQRPKFLRVGLQVQEAGYTGSRPSLA